MEPLRIWIGYSSDESRAFTVCAKSIKHHSSIPVEIYPLRQDWLRALGMYWREREPGSATEFSFSRFLVPALAGYNGPALYLDCDFLFLADIAELFALYDPTYAIQCVQHEHVPTELTKMNGLVQTQNLRKNWSSLMLFNTGKPVVGYNLTPYAVNIRSGKWLHRFEFCDDSAIGQLPKEWNFLVGHTAGVEPKALHFTDGIRALHGTTSACDYLWEEEERA